MSGVFGKSGAQRHMGRFRITHRSSHADGQAEPGVGAIYGGV